MLKGLILKDIYGIRFQIVCGFLLMCFPNILSFFSLNAKSNLTPEDLTILVFVYGMVNFLTIAVCSSFVLNTGSYDERSGWSKMQFTMPVSPGQIVGAKMAVIALVPIALTVVSIIFNLIAVILGGIPVEPMITMPVCICLIQTTAMYLAYMLGLKYGAKRTSFLYLFILMAEMAAAILIIKLCLDNGSFAALRIAGYGALPLLTVGTAVLSYSHSKKVIGLF